MPRLTASTAGDSGFAFAPPRSVGSAPLPAARDPSGPAAEYEPFLNRPFSDTRCHNTKELVQQRGRPLVLRVTRWAGGQTLDYGATWLKDREGRKEPRLAVAMGNGTWVGQFGFHGVSCAWHRSKAMLGEAACFRMRLTGREAWGHASDVRRLHTEAGGDGEGDGDAFAPAFAAASGGTRTHSGDAPSGSPQTPHGHPAAAETAADPAAETVLQTVLQELASLQGECCTVIGKTRCLLVRAAWEGILFARRRALSLVGSRRRSCSLYGVLSIATITAAGCAQHALKYAGPAHGHAGKHVSATRV